MLSWKKNQHGTTALLIRGARRVGKSTVAEQFARNEYESYILVDFSTATQTIHRLFEDVSNLDYIFTQLQLNYRTSLKPRKSVIIFDEIQKQPLARQAIKTLVADGRYDYIETGSLLSIKRKRKSAGNSEQQKNILIPSEETRLDMYPMDYEEFRWALGDDQTIPLLPSGQTSDLFHAIPAQLSSNASRYQVSSVIEGGKVDRLRGLINILKDSMTVNIAYHANDPSAGLASHINRDQFKLFCGDTGLFVTLAFWDDKFTENVIYQKLLSDKLKADVGYVYENVVSQILTATGNKLYYHTWPTPSGKHNYEIDFLLSRKAKICPIEVKSSTSNLHVSIDEFQKKFSARILQRYLLHSKDIRKERDLIMLPMYMAIFL